MTEDFRYNDDGWVEATSFAWWFWEPGGGGFSIGNEYLASFCHELEPNLLTLIRDTQAHPTHNPTRVSENLEATLWDRHTIQHSYA